MQIKPLILISLSIFLLLSCSRNPNETVVITGPTMGTVYQVKFVLDQVQQVSLDKQALEQEIESTLLNINALMSTYIKDSELSRLNHSPAGIPFELSEETAYVLNEAIRLEALSQGALDITVGPLVNLWGFGPELKPEQVPDETQLSAIQAYVGIDKFSLTNRSVIKEHADVYIDLSTIAKGYAVDRLAQLLESYSITNYLVDIGGEMRVSGRKAGDKDWLIAIEKPITNQRAVQRVIVIGNNAIATSGDYRNYFEDNGVRYSHLIDPTTAKPIQHNLVAVSVVSPSTMTADGLATALIVMGKEKGLSLAEKEGIAALFITKEGDEFKEYRSSSFDKLVTVKK